MLDLQVKGMTCGHCEAAVTRAVRSVDPKALKQAIGSEGYLVEP